MDILDERPAGRSIGGTSFSKQLAGRIAGDEPKSQGPGECNATTSPGERADPVNPKELVELDDPAESLASPLTRPLKPGFFESMIRIEE